MKYEGKYFENSETFVTKDENVLYIIYRGTDFNNIYDILTDIDIVKVQPFGKGNGLIHEGFFHRSRLNFGITIDSRIPLIQENSILDMIKKTNAQKIIFTGHSLGGAVAQLSFIRYITFCQMFHENYASRFKQSAQVITFGTPMCMTQKIQDRFKMFIHQMHSIEKYNDPIIEIVRDVERVYQSRIKENPSQINDDYIDNEAYKDEQGKVLTVEQWKSLHKQMKEDIAPCPTNPDVGTPLPIRDESAPPTPSFRSLFPFGVFNPISMPIGYHHIVYYIYINNNSIQNQEKY